MSILITEERMKTNVKENDSYTLNSFELDKSNWCNPIESMHNLVSPFSNDVRSGSLNHSITFAPLSTVEEEHLGKPRNLTHFVPELTSLNMEQSNFLYSFYCNPTTAKPESNNDSNQIESSLDNLLQETVKKNEERSLQSSIIATVVTNPAEFQIANYNIYPSPSLQLNNPLLFNRTIYISLVEAATSTVIPAGFQSGDVRILRPGTQQIQFTGLKLNKKKVINAEVRSRKFNQYDCNFKIRFTIGNQHWYTESFKLVSSYSQLPNEVRDYVRPSKLAKRPSPVEMQFISKTPRTLEMSPSSIISPFSDSSSSSPSPNMYPDSYYGNTDEELLAHF